MQSPQGQQQFPLFLLVGPRKTLNEDIKSNKERKKVSKDLAEDKCLEVFHKKPFNPGSHG